MKKLSLLNKLNKLSLNLTPVQQIDFVVHGLRDGQLQRMTLAAQCQDINALKAFFCTYDGTGERKSTKSQPSNDRNKGKKRSYPFIEGQVHKQQGDPAKLQNIKCYKCSQYGHYQSNCPSNAEQPIVTNESQEAKLQSVKCFTCDQYGHNKRNCPSKTGQSTDTSKPYCSVCKSSTHTDKQCWSKKNKAKVTNDK